MRAVPAVCGLRPAKGCVMALVRQRIVISCLMVGLVGVALAVPQSGMAADGATELADLSHETRRVIEQLGDDDFNATVQMIQDAGINELNPEFAGDVLTDGFTEGTLVLRYLESAPSATKVLSIVESLKGKTPVPIVAEPTQVDIGNLNETAAVLTANNGDLAREHGIANVTGVETNLLTGRIILLTSDQASVDAAARNADGTPSIMIDGIPVEVAYEPAGAAEAGFQASRVNDDPSWSGAIHLLSGTGLTNPATGMTFDCTAGFNWRKWGTNEILGSTAEHCHRYTGVSTWRNAGTIVGNRYYYDIAADTFLMRSDGWNSRFNPNVYFGSRTTSDRRWVVADVTTNQAGRQVALNSGWGLRAPAVVLPYTRTVATSWGTIGPIQFADTTACDSGDSGGPWLQTYTNGDVIGVGQHSGRFGVAELGGAARCGFIPQVQISAELSASIYKY